MPADRHALPALERLTADVATAMRAAEAAEAAGPRRARWWRRTPPLAVTLLALAVPSAIALHATAGDGHGDTAVPVPGLRAPHQAVAIARGVVHGHHSTFAAFRCDSGRTVGAAMLLTGAASVGRCSSTPLLTARRRPLTASALWSPGQTWIYGIAAADVATVDFRVLRQAGHRFFAPRWTRVATRAFDPRAVAQGHLPRGLRYVLLYRARRSLFSDAVARDARGRIVFRCALPGVGALSRRDGSRAAAAEPRPCA
jgi:hypothetical protein